MISTSSLNRPIPDTDATTYIALVAVSGLALAAVGTFLFAANFFNVFSAIWDYRNTNLPESNLMERFYARWVDPLLWKFLAVAFFVASCQIALGLWLAMNYYIFDS